MKNFEFDTKSILQEYLKKHFVVHFKFDGKFYVVMATVEILGTLSFFVEDENENEIMT